MSSPNFVIPVPPNTTIQELNNIIAAASSSVHQSRELANSPNIPQHNDHLQHQTQYFISLNDKELRPSKFSEHQKLFLFIKILLKFLNSNGETELAFRVKSVVSECIHMNRTGDPTYTPLRRAIVQRLRPLPGLEAYWSLTQKCVGSKFKRAPISAQTQGTYKNNYCVIHDGGSKDCGRRSPIMAVAHFV